MSSKKSKKCKTSNDSSNENTDNTDGMKSYVVTFDKLTAEAYNKLPLTAFFENMYPGKLLLTGYGPHIEEWAKQVNAEWKNSNVKLAGEINKEDFGP